MSGYGPSPPRRAEILEAVGPDASARARQIATLTTRHVKEREATPETLRERWQARAAEIGLGREAIAATHGKEVQLTAKLTLDQLDRQVTAHASHFDRRDAVQAVADLLPNGAPAPEVEAVADAFLASDAVSGLPRAPKASASPPSASGRWSVERWRRSSG